MAGLLEAITSAAFSPGLPHPSGLHGLSASMSIASIGVRFSSDAGGSD